MYVAAAATQLDIYKKTIPFFFLKKNKKKGGFK